MINRDFFESSNTPVDSKKLAEADDAFFESQKAEEMKTKIIVDQWPESYRVIRDSFPHEVKNYMIRDFCGLKNKISSFQRYKKDPPMVQSRYLFFLDYMLASGYYLDPKSVKRICERFCGRRDPYAKNTLIDIVYCYICSAFDYECDILPLLLDGKISPIHNYFLLASDYMKYNELIGHIQPGDYFQNKGIKRNEFNNNSTSLSVKVERTENSKTIHEEVTVSFPKSVKDLIGFLKEIIKESKSLQDRLSITVFDKVDDRIVYLKRQKGRAISLNSALDLNGKDTLYKKYMEYRKNPAINPFTRDDTISLGVILAMPLEEINDLLISCGLDPLVYKTPSDCLLLYVLSQLKRNDLLDIDMASDDILMMVNRHTIAEFLGDYYPDAKEKVIHTYLKKYLCD